MHLNNAMVSQMKNNHSPNHTLNLLHVLTLGIGPSLYSICDAMFHRACFYASDSLLEKDLNHSLVNEWRLIYEFFCRCIIMCEIGIG